MAQSLIEESNLTSVSAPPTGYSHEDYGSFKTSKHQYVLMNVKFGVTASLANTYLAIAFLPETIALNHIVYAPVIVSNGSNMYPTICRVTNSAIEIWITNEIANIGGSVTAYLNFVYPKTN